MNSKFEDDIFALDAIIEIVFTRELKYKTTVIYEKYRIDSLKTESAQSEIDENIKIAVKRCLILLSTTYRKQLYKTFSKDGLVYYIYSFFYNLFVSELENKISPT
jgi:septin family protein